MNSFNSISRLVSLSSLVSGVLGETIFLLKVFLNLSDLPIVPTLLARVTFLNFEFAHNLPESLFNVPSDYTETTDRFRDLYSGQ